MGPNEGSTPLIGPGTWPVKGIREKNFPPGTRVRMRVLEVALGAVSRGRAGMGRMGRKGSDVGCRVAKWEKVG